MACLGYIPDNKSKYENVTKKTTYQKNHLYLIFLGLGIISYLFQK